MKRENVIPHNVQRETTQHYTKLPMAYGGYVAEIEYYLGGEVDSVQLQSKTKTTTNQS